MIVPFFFSLGSQHKLTVVEADGNFVEPFDVDSIDIYSGESYSVLLVGTGEPRHRAQTTRTPWNTERGHHGGDGELDTHTRERER